MCSWREVRAFMVVAVSAAGAQMVDNSQAPNIAKADINKSLQGEIGAGRGSISAPNSSLYIISRDPFRSVRRGRQLFQRKFTRAQGHGPNENDGVGDINTNIAIGAGSSDSCALCHGRPRGSAGVGGNVVTHPTAAMLRTCSALDCAKCWPTKSPPTCATFAQSPWSERCGSSIR